MDSNYDDTNRAFVQAFMARSAMTLDEGKQLLASIFSAHDHSSIDPTDVPEDQFQGYISSANAAISPFDFEIRSTLRQIPQEHNTDASESPPERIYALVNTTSDPLTQLATIHTPDQIAFLKRVLDYMFDTNNTRLCEGMVITHIQAANLARPSAGERHRRESGNEDSQGGAVGALTMTEAETMVQHLLSEGWLEKSTKDFISLTPRGLMELRHWLVNEYNEERQRIKFCAACRDIMTVGQRCSDRDCLGRLHDHCTQTFFRMQRAEACPLCQEPWSGDNFVGERAVIQFHRNRGADAPARRSRTSEPSTQQTLVGESADTSDEGQEATQDGEEEDDNDEEEEEEA